MCVNGYMWIFLRSFIFLPENNKPKNIFKKHQMLVFYWCVSKMQRISEKRKEKKTKALFSGFEEGQGEWLPCCVYIQEHSVQLYVQASFTSYNASIWIGYNSCSETLTLQIFLLRFHIFDDKFCLIQNLLHSI